MAEPPNPARGAVAVLSEKEALANCSLPRAREPPVSTSAKKVRSEKKAPRRAAGDKESGGNDAAAELWQPAAWSLAAGSSASSPATSRSGYSSASPSERLPSRRFLVSCAQPQPRTLLVAPQAAARSASCSRRRRSASCSGRSAGRAKLRRPKEKREKEMRRYGGAARRRDENCKAKPLQRD